MGREKDNVFSIIFNENEIYHKMHTFPMHETACVADSSERLVITARESQDKKSHSLLSARLFIFFMTMTAHLN